MDGEDRTDDIPAASDAGPGNRKEEAAREQTPIQQLLEILPPDAAAALMACAIPHWFDREIFTWMMHGQDEDQGWWDTILSYPFVSPDTEVKGRYRLHPKDRRDVLSYLKSRDEGRFRGYQADAAGYFLWRLGERVQPPTPFVDREPAPPADDYEREIWQREAMYHLLAADEQVGLARFQQLFRAAKQQHQVAVCRVLLKLGEEQEAELSEHGRRRLKVYADAAVFVGRQRELETFRQLLEAERGLRILYLFGKAGLGKTKLLEEIWEAYCLVCDLDLPANLIDLYEMDHRRVTGVEYRIAQLLGRDYFTGYFHAFEEYARLRDESAPPTREAERLNMAREQVYQAFVADLQHLSYDQPILLMFDTFEAARDTDVGEWLASSFLPAVRDLNIILVFAARLPPPDFRGLQERITCLELKDLSRDDVRQYFNERRLAQNRALADQVHERTGGHPILVALTCDLMEKKGTSSLDRLLATRDGDVGLALTRAFLEANPDKERLVSLMALARYRFNDELLASLENASLEQARALIDGISDYTSFTKLRSETYTCALHDMVRDAVLRLRWQDATQRKPLDEKIIAYYSSEIKQLSAANQRQSGYVPIESDIQVLEAERLFFELDVDFQGRLERFNDQFRTAMNSYQLGTGELLARTMKEYRHAFRPGERLDEVDFIETELAFQQGRYAVADDLAQTTLKKDNLAEGVAARAWLMRGRVAQRQGDLLNAEGFCSRSLRLTEGKREFDRLAAPALDILGYIRRVQGEWNEAAQFYEQNMLIRKRTEDPRGTAATQNNLAYVYMLQGRPRRALRLVEEALATREKLVQQKLGNKFELGLSYNTRSTIRRSIGNWKGFDDDLAMAKIIFDDISSQRGQALVNMNYGLRERLHRQNPKEAVRYFQNSVEMFRKLGDQERLAEAMNELALSYLDADNWQEAEGAFVEALNLVEAIRNKFMIADILSNMCQLYLFIRKPDKITDCVRQYKRVDGYRFHYPSARLFVILGDAARRRLQVGPYLRYGLLSLWYWALSLGRLIRYAGFEWKVYLSWYRDWQRWRDRTRRMAG
jgi:tetratricopeptide (TPR) repeat protein